MVPSCPSGQTIMHIVKAEMGQHIGTALAQIIAEELEVDWSKVTLDYPEASVEDSLKSVVDTLIADTAEGL